MSLFGSLFGIVISVSIYYDNRKKTKIMAKQLEIQKNELEIQKRENASKNESHEAIIIIRQAKKEFLNIKPFYREWDIGILDMQMRDIVSDVMKTLHDSGKDKLTITMKKKVLVDWERKGNNKILENPRFEDFKEWIEVIQDEPHKMHLGFNSEPDIGVLSCRLSMGDCVYEILTILNLFKRLNSTSDLINVYDPSLLSDLHTKYDSLLSSFFNAFIDVQVLSFDRNMKTENIENEFLKIIGYDAINRILLALLIAIPKRLNDLEIKIRDSA